MSLTYFSRLFSRLQSCIREDIPSALPLNNDSLRAFLNATLSSEPGNKTSLIGDPCFEATFGWRLADKCLKDLNGTLLDKRFVQCLSTPPEELRSEYAFPLSRKPYTHQLEAWKILCQKNPASVIVSSGTGSGKTECFMIPILNRLARQSSQEGGALEGVRALFLYPLNALISSQRDRLDAWTRGFNGDVRFCLYNGNTPESLPSHAKTHGNEVLSRKDLRTSPPPILFTNASMLEYMLIRTEDAPILQKSQGKLEWIVLDEAHCYIGSQAAEISLLLRRAQMAFGVRPDSVRFVATSATIGDPNGKAGQELKSFLADIAGVPISQVLLITGNRNIPANPELSKSNPEKMRAMLSGSGCSSALDELEAMSPEESKNSARYNCLWRSKIAKALRELLTQDRMAARLSEIRMLLERNGIASDVSHALRWLDILSGTEDSDGTAFLPLRAHIFCKGLSGLWGCADPNCPDKQKELQADWPYGAVWTEVRETCSCGSPVFEIITCKGCGSPFLLVQKQDIIDKDGRPATFLLQNDHEAPLEEDDILIDEEATIVRRSNISSALLIPPRITSESLFLEKNTRKLMDKKVNGAIRIDLRDAPNPDGTLFCPRCGEGARGDLDFYYYNFISTNYLQNSIAQVLLEYAPDGIEPASHPCRGRKILTFNDSRQGTARSAMRMQLFSELTRIRGVLYHICVQDSQQNNTDERISLEREISTLENLDPNVRKTLQAMIYDKKQKLKQLAKIAPISFKDMATALQNARSTFDTLFRLYQEKAPMLIRANAGEEDFARMLIFREFGRRPARSVNLETLGLMAVRYPAINHASNIPQEFQSAKLTLDDWKDFLKICVDVVFRANGATDFPRTWRKWLGMTYRQSYILPPDSKRTERFQLVWPQCHAGRQHKLVLMLERILKLDLKQWDHADRINLILKQTWDQLANNPELCSRQEDGYLLRASSMSFSPLQKAWLCPFTRRFLDTTFHGISPFLPYQSANSAECLEYSIPLYPKPFGPASENGVEEAREWLRKNDDIQKLRQAGLWFSNHDNVVELSPYFRVQEHSAQLASSELLDCTQKFKAGDINILSCSTTMEMGIDIGGISIVGMNNVPPHPANYLQRAGRSGRRGETRAIAFTMCKNNPHEMAIFSNSGWAFETPLPIPKVSLNSRVILQRHVNALLLTDFLKNHHQNDDKDMSKLACEAFFIGKPSMSAIFSSHFKAARLERHLKEYIEILCRRGMFEHESPEVMAEKAAEAMDWAYKRWFDDYDALCKIEKAMLNNGDKQDSAARRAITLRKTRMAKEYLLKELISREFLPAHGFPLHVATFDTMHFAFLQSHKNSKLANPGRADNMFMRRELPSRSLASALTEYAPGNSVAINGLVYQSKGVTLNWHIPASEKAAAELQNIRSHWRCKTCGNFGSASSHSLSVCPNCGTPLTAQSWHEYLEPAGFAVDFFEEPSNNVSLGIKGLSQAEADVCASGSWTSLGLPQAARFRCVTSGSVFYRSRGLYGYGYAVCLACGRVESVSTPGEIPAAIRKHKKLRGGKEENDPANHVCPACRDGMQWKIKMPLWLASEIKTDVLEVQIRKENQTWLNDKDQAFPIAIALRDSLAACLGIQTEELDCTVATRKQEEGTLCTSIFVFDKNSAGYSSSAAQHMTRLLSDARERLLCRQHNCDTACPHCILSFDLRYKSKEFDRHKGLEILTDKYLNVLELPAEARIFGSSTQTETLPLEESVLDVVLHRPNARVFLHLGENSLWQPGDDEMLHFLDILRLRGIHVSLALEQKLFHSFSDEERMLLAPFRYGNVDCVVIEGGFTHPNAHLAVSIQDSETLYRWASYRTDSFSLLLKGSTQNDLGSITMLLDKDILPGSNDSSILQIGENENITLDTFGDWFWFKLRNLLVKNLGNDFIQSHKPIRSILFSDRYCNSPIAVALLHNLLSYLQKQYGDDWNFPKCHIFLADAITGNHNFLWDNWGNALDRNEVVSELLRDVMQVNVSPMKKTDMPHARSIKFIFENDSKLHIWLDQGLGFLRITHDNIERQFPFHESPQEQATRLRTMNVKLSVVNGGTVISLKSERPLEH